METHPKLRRLPTMFSTSCGSRTLSDVINNSVAAAAATLPRPFPSIRRPPTSPTDTPPSPVTIADILKGQLCPSAAPPSTPPRHLLHQKRRSSKKVLETPPREEDEEEETDTMFSSRRLSSDSLAVVKKSRDPEGDFRRSMVEMIVEKEMFGAEDLEGLLECFLELNSPRHHRVIVEVFTEIWDAIFPNWC